MLNWTHNPAHNGVNTRFQGVGPSLVSQMFHSSSTDYAVGQAKISKFAEKAASLCHTDSYVIHDLCVQNQFDKAEDSRDTLVLSRNTERFDHPLLQE